MISLAQFEDEQARDIPREVTTRRCITGTHFHRLELRIPSGALQVYRGEHGEEEEHVARDGHVVAVLPHVLAIPLTLTKRTKLRKPKLAECGWGALAPHHHTTHTALLGD